MSSEASNAAQMLRRRSSRTTFVDSNNHNGATASPPVAPKQVSLEKGLGRLGTMRFLRRNAAATTEELSASTSGTFSHSVARHHQKDGRRNGAASQLKYGFSLRAREHIAVGFFDQAIIYAQKQNDIVAWALALMLSGEPEKGIDIIEAFIISACLVTYQETHKDIKDVKFDFRQILASVIGTPGAPATSDIMKSLPPPTEDLYRQTIEDVCETADWEELHQWYLLGVFFHSAYTPPTNPWLRQFFGLYWPSQLGDTDKKKTSISDGVGGGGGGGPSRRRKHGGTNAVATAAAAAAATQHSKPITRHDVEDILISQCTTQEIHTVNAIVSWRLCRYRTAIRSASEVLKGSPADIQMRYIRCSSALCIGERMMVSEDCSYLMQSASMFVSTVGCALATFGVPLESVRVAVEEYRASVEEQRYVYSLCEWAHSLVLMSIGDFKSAKSIIDTVIPVAPPRSLSKALLHTYVTCCIALEDSAALLEKHNKYRLTPYHQLYVALAPRFGGGLDNDSINQIAIESPVGELLNPLNVKTYSDVRQMIAIHTITARTLFSYGQLREAWVEISTAVGCSEEILGSAIFALTDCAPHRVYFLGCTIGMTLLDKLIDEDELAAKELSPAELKKKREQDDKLGDEIIETCRAWARAVRDFHPNQVLGHAAITQVSIASHDLDSMERAVAMTEHFPDCVMTQNALSFALYSKHLIPDAVAQAQKTLQRFPHVYEVARMAFAVSGKDGVYTFLYRGLLPFQYGSSESDNTTWRSWFAFFVTLLNFIILIGMFVCNLNDSIIPFPTAAMDTVDRLRVTSMIPFAIAGALCVYSLIATVYQPTLVSILFTDLHVRNTRLNRFLFSSRGIAWINVVNALQISVLGNNFRFQSMWYTVLLYSLLTLLQFPYSSRTFFLRSVDEPHMALPFWITLVGADLITFLIMAPFLFLISMTEPLFFAVFFVMIPPMRPDLSASTIPVRLQVHQRALAEGAPGRFCLKSGSQFIYLRMMEFLFWKTHSDMETYFLGQQQQEEDDLRAFPLMDILESIATEPIKLAQPLSPEELKRHEEEEDRKHKRVLYGATRQRAAAATSGPSSTVGTAKAGEGNLAGILDDLDGGDEAMHDDLNDLSLAGDGGAGEGTFGADVMALLNAEFEKLSAQNAAWDSEKAKVDAIKYGARGASGAAGGGGNAAGGVGESGAAPGIAKLGDVGLYRENRERTDMLTAGPILRQMHARPRNSLVAATEGVGMPSFEAPDGFSRGRRAAMQNNRSVAEAFTAAEQAHKAPLSGDLLGARGATSSALLKPTVRRTKSIFHRHDSVDNEFAIDDDMDESSDASGVAGGSSRAPSETRSADPSRATQAAAAAAAVSGLFGTHRQSFGAAVAGSSDSDSSVSSSNDDDESDKRKGKAGRKSARDAKRSENKSNHSATTATADKVPTESHGGSQLSKATSNARTRAGAAVHVVSPSEAAVAPPPASSASGGGTSAPRRDSAGSLSNVSMQNSETLWSDDEDDNDGDKGEADLTVTRGDSDVTVSTVSTAAPPPPPPMQPKPPAAATAADRISVSPQRVTPPPAAVPDDSTVSSHAAMPTSTAGRINSSSNSVGAVQKPSDLGQKKRSVVSFAEHTGERGESPASRWRAAAAAAAAASGGTTSSRPPREDDSSEDSDHHNNATSSDDGGGGSNSSGGLGSRRQSSMFASGLASAYATQLRRKHSTLLQQHADLMESTPFRGNGQGAAAGSSETASTGGSQRKKSIREVVMQAVQSAAAPQQQLLQQVPSAVPTAESTTRPALPTTLQRRQTVRAAKDDNSLVQDSSPGSPDGAQAAAVSESSFAKRSTSAPGTRQDMAELAAATTDEIKPVNGTLKVKRLLEELHYARTSVQELLTAQRLSLEDPSMVSVKRQLLASKQKFVADLQKIGPRVSVDSFDTKKQLGELFVDTVREGDLRRIENVELVSALLRTISNIDFVSLVIGKDLLTHAIEQGNGSMLSAMLLHKPLLAQLTSQQMTSFLQAVQTKSDRRCSLLLALLEVASQCHVCISAGDLMRGLWQETLTKVISLQQSMVTEDRTDLPALLDAALHFQVSRLDFELESPSDRQTIFSRACREGDLVTVKHLLARNAVRDVNRLQSDGSNALQQAVAKNHVAVVELLLSHKAIAKSVLQTFPGKGTVLDIARSLRRDPKIVDLLANAALQHASSPGSAAGSSPPTAVASPEAFPDASHHIKTLLPPIRTMSEQLEITTRMGGAPEEEIRRLSDALRQQKESVAVKIERLPGSNDLGLQTKEARDLLLAFVDTCVKEGEGKPGNVALLNAVIKRFAASQKYAHAALSRFWLYRAAENGSKEMLRALLSIRGMREAVASKQGVATREIVEAASRSVSTRAEVLLVLLEFSSVLMFAEFRDNLRNTWQKVLTEICSLGGAATTAQQQQQQPSKDQRLLFVEKVIASNGSGMVAVDFETEQPRDDHQTIFSRAAVEGDVALLKLLLDSGVVKNPNRCQSDGRCALTAAIAAGKLASVEFFTSPRLKHVIDVNVNTAEGTPMHVAQKLRAGDKILECLRLAGASA